MQDDVVSKTLAGLPAFEWIYALGTTSRLDFTWQLHTWELYHPSKQCDQDSESNPHRNIYQMIQIHSFSHLNTACYNGEHSIKILYWYIWLMFQHQALGVLFAYSSSETKISVVANMPEPGLFRDAISVEGRSLRESWQRPWLTSIVGTRRRDFKTFSPAKRKPKTWLVCIISFPNWTRIKPYNRVIYIVRCCSKFWNCSRLTICFSIMATIAGFM